MADETVISIHRPGGEVIALTLKEYRLVLLGLVDFEGDWEALQTAASFVTDGPAKAALIRDRLLPMAGQLSVVLGRGVDGLELMAARHWFRNGE